MTRPEALANLTFGFVDAESNKDLDQRFLRTDAFDRLISPDTFIVRGPKGTGKSALFELVTKYALRARRLAGHALDGVLPIAGTGYPTLDVIATSDLQRLQSEGEYSH